MDRRGEKLCVWIGLFGFFVVSGISRGLLLFFALCTPCFFPRVVEDPVVSLMSDDLRDTEGPWRDVYVEGRERCRLKGDRRCTRERTAHQRVL